MVGVPDGEATEGGEVVVEAGGLSVNETVAK